MTVHGCAIAAAAVLGLSLLIHMLHAGVAAFDASYAAIWGRDLAQGDTTLVFPTGAPTPHPLSLALGALGSTADAGRELLLWVSEVSWAWEITAAGVLAVLCVGSRRKVSAIAAGAVAGAALLSRPELALLAKNGTLDHTFAALCLTAVIAYVSNKPHLTAGLLTVATLHRPEAWVFTAMALVWWPLEGRSRRRYAWLLPAPLAWLLMGASFGDPLIAATSTQGNASTLARPTGLGTAITDVIPALASGIGWPAVVLAAAAMILATRDLLRRRPIRTRRPSRPHEVGAALLVLVVLAFLVQGAAGTPLLPRYLVLGHTLVAVLASWFVFTLPRRPLFHRRGRARLAPMSVLVAMAALGVSAVVAAGRYPDLRGQLDSQQAVETSLHEAAVAAAVAPGCDEVYVGAVAQLPVVALMLNADLDQVRPLPAAAPTAGWLLRPKTPSTVNNSGFGPEQDASAAMAVPDLFTIVADTDRWTLYARCPTESLAR